jgi:hypothetical protein
MKNHNKKRNTAFLYEVLVLEAAKALREGDSALRTKTISLLKEYFGPERILAEDLECYSSLTTRSSLEQYTAEKLIHKIKEKYLSLDREQVFAEQSRLIKTINQDLGTNVFRNFVPNYKSYASIAQIFNRKTGVKNRVILEQQVLGVLTSSEPLVTERKDAPADGLVMKSYVKMFNKKYGNLLPEQKNLLGKYIFAGLPEGHLDLKVALSEELNRLLSAVKNSLQSQEVASDKQMIANTRKVIDLMENMHVNKFGKEEIIQVLKIQNLVSEYGKDDA